MGSHESAQHILYQKVQGAPLLLTLPEPFEQKMQEAPGRSLKDCSSTRLQIDAKESAETF
jgi:hypothetical protein